VTIPSTLATTLSTAPWGSCEILDAVEDRADCYDATDDRSVSADVRKWAIEQGGDKRIRIALCGYAGEHEMPDTWECVEWKARGGYGSQAEDGNENCKRERIWFSPHCISARRLEQEVLFT
jgi:hypothetical protein